MQEHEKKTARLHLPACLRGKWLPLLVVLIAVGLDMLTKRLVVLYLKPIGSFALLPGIFHLTYATNTGAAWSLFSAPEQRWIFMSVSTVAILALLAYLLLAKIPSRCMQIGLGAMVGGGIGNMIDRISLGYVVDFLDACCIRFPIFNVADCFVCVGAGLLMLALLLEWWQERRGGADDDHAVDQP